MRRVWVVAACLAWAPVLGAVSEGDLAPAFKLPDQTGTVRDLYAEYGHRYVALFFYPKDGTAGCTRQARSVSSLYQDLQDLGIAVYGISVQDVASKKAFCAQQQLKMPLLADVDKRVTDAYGALAPTGVAARWTFILDPALIVRAVLKNVNVDKHGDEILTQVLAVKQRDGETALAGELTAPQAVLKGLRMALPAEWPKWDPAMPGTLTWRHAKLADTYVMVGDLPSPAPNQPLTPDLLRGLLQGATARVLEPLSVGRTPAYRVEISGAPHALACVVWAHGKMLRGVMVQAPKDRADDCSRLLARLAGTIAME